MTNSVYSLAALLAAALVLEAGNLCLPDSNPLFAAGSAARQSEKAVFTNPVNNKDMPDPGAIFDGGEYWMTHTMGGIPACPLWRSKDMIHWTFETHLLVESNAPRWVKDRFWAPELHRVGSTYILLYTSGDVTGRLCIGSATATHITGPYKTGEFPLVSQEGMGVIDPTLFEDTAGRCYLLWKDDGNDIGKPCHIFIQEMDRSHPGAAFAKGSRPEILITSMPDGWEHGIVEGPEMVHENGWYYLFYSGSGYTSNYAEGVARSRRITGPYEKCPRNPLLQGNAVWANPGHGAFLKDRRGAMWHLYHAYHANNRKLGRVQLLDRVRFDNADGWPTIGTDGTPTVAEQESPNLIP